MDNTPRPKRKRVSPVVKIAVICILLVFVVISIKMNIDINDKKSELNIINEELRKRELEIQKTESEIDTFVLNEDTIKKIAREKLGLRENDTIIFENSQPN